MKNGLSSIKVKLILPITFILLIISALIFFFVKAKTKDKINKLAKTDSEFVIKYIYNNIDRTAEKATAISSIFASIENVKNAYAIENEDAARLNLHSVLKTYLSNIKKYTKIGDDLRIHFHKSLAKSFLRTWRKQGDGDGGDDLASFRKSVLKVSHNQIPVKGIEVGKGGLVIRGISPIFDKKKYIGSVENFYSLDNLMSQLILNGNQNLSVFLDKKSADIAWQLQDNPNVGSFRFVAQNKEIPISAYQEEFLKRGETNEFMTVNETEAITVFPIFDFEGNKAGVFYYTFDLSNIIAEENATANFLLTRLVIAFLFIFIALFFITHFYISKPLDVLAKIFKKISKGKLDHNFNINQKDEIGKMGKNAEAMVDKIKRILFTVKLASGQLSIASTEISNAAQQVSSGASEQASTSEEVTASIDEIMQEINRNADNANITNEIAKNSSGDLEKTNNSVYDVVTAMKVINEKIKFIDDIANKTDLLALNAAVESARAGKEGKGFSVVSAEIKKLANKTQKLATEIIELSETSLIKAKKTGKEIAQSVPEIKKTFNLIDEISASSQSQKTSIINLNTAINEMNSVTQENAASSEQLASNSQELNAQAEMLEDTISFFKFTNDKEKKKTIIKIEKENREEKQEEVDEEVKKIKDFNLGSEKLDDYEEF